VLLDVGFEAVSSQFIALFIIFICVDGEELVGGHLGHIFELFLLIVFVFEHVPDLVIHFASVLLERFLFVHFN
jgi:hypothetical protein